MLNFGNIEVKAMHTHKIAKAMWDPIKTMYENVDKAFVVVLDQFFSQLEIKEDETFTSFLTNFKATKTINQGKRLTTLMKKQHYNSCVVYQNPMHKFASLMFDQLCQALKKHETML